MNVPKVTLIVPIYNTLEFLDRCLNSIKNQTFKDFEVILVNDGSPDNSKAYCEEFIKSDSRFILKNKENGGLASARNYGMKFAKGEYISFIDSDDYVSLDYCGILYNIAFKNNIDILNFGLTYVKNNAETFRFSVLPKDRLIEGKEIQKYLLESSKNKLLWYAWNSIFRREFLIENTISFDKSLLLGEDSLFNLKCFYKAKSVYSISEPLYYYVYNYNSLTQTKYKNNLLDKIEIQFDKRLEFHESNMDINNKFFYKDISKNYIEHSLFMLLSNVSHSVGVNRILEIKKIRSSKIFKFSFDYYEYSSTLTAKMKLMIFLFRKKYYYLLNSIIWKTD